jgi:hypothetical protein
MKTDDKMPLEVAAWWLEALGDNLLDREYCTDDEAHFKAAAIARLLERNAELEDGLQKAWEAKELIAKAIANIL